MLSVGTIPIVTSATDLASANNVATAPAAEHRTLTDLPVAAQHAISSQIGRDQTAYHAESAEEGASLANVANGFTAEFQSGTLHVSAGSDSWDMSLEQFGYDGAMQQVGTGVTSTDGNRVDCDYGTISEWYVNGPAGLEQGFVVAPPLSGAGELLTVELALGGSLTGTVNEARDGLTLTRTDGSVVLGYTGLVAYDATGKALPAWLELQVDGDHPDLLIQVDSSGSQGEITIDPFVQSARLTPSSGVTYNFGYSIAVSGDTVVVSDPYATVDGKYYQGIGYVFVASNSGWANMTQTAKLTASDGRAYDSLGWSVAISGNTVVLGTMKATSPSYPHYDGAVYVFTRPASGWTNATETAKLTASGAGIPLGYSVAISGDTVVSALSPPSMDARGTAAAYVFVRPSGGWTNMTETAKLAAADDRTGDLGEMSVSISGDTVVVGAPFALFNGGSASGAAYVYVKPSSGWTNMTQTARLLAPDRTRDTQFGFSVSISGNTVVVGVPYAKLGSNEEQGKAYVFTKPTSGWANTNQAARLIASDGNGLSRLGYSVSISGDTIAIGAYHADYDKGAVYVFAKPASGWTDMTQTTKLTVESAGYLGRSVAISGGTIAAGAVHASANGGFEGTAYVFGTPTVTPPSISGIVVAEGGATKNGKLESNEPLRITWAATGANGIASQTVTVDGRSITPIGGPYSNLYYSCAIGKLPAGSHAYTIKSTDSKGVSSTRSGTFNVIVASVAPPTISGVVVAEAGATKNGKLESGEKLKITWAASSASRITSQTMTVDGRSITPINGPYSSLYYSCAIGTYSAGSHRYTITATDSRGVSSTKTGTFTVLAPAPPLIAGIVVAEAGTTKNGKLEPNESLKITWAASSSNGIASQTLTVDGKTKTPINGPYSGLYYSCAIGKYLAGSHSYTIKTTDSKGISSTKTGTFTVAAISTSSARNGVASDLRLDLLTAVMRERDDVSCCDGASM